MNRQIADKGSWITHRGVHAPIEIGGTELLCDLSGAVYWPAENCLLVSDLHLEKGSSFARRGHFLPPYDTRSTLSALALAIEKWNPASVVALGDNFHDPGGFARLDRDDRAKLEALQANRQWMWIGGNHDPARPEGLGGEWMEEISIGRIRLLHEPDISGRGPEISGHLHPLARIVGRGKSVRRKCYASDGRRLILPAFGAYTGGLNLRDRAFHGLFDTELLFALTLGDTNLYRICHANLR